MELLVTGWLFIFGLVIGSFLNVVIYRSVNGESPFKGRSHCDHCGKLVDWKENIPLLSFVILRGKCANCKKRISWQYPVVELLVGLLFVWWYWMGRGFFLLAADPFTWAQPAFWLVVGIVLLMVVVYDLAYYLIPDFLTIPLVVLTLLYRIGLGVTGQMRWVDLITSGLAGLILAWFFMGLYLGTGKKGFGLGDVKLAPALGLLLGWQKTLVMIFMAFILGATVALVLMALGKKKLGQTIPFGPFLVLATILSLLWGGLIWDWYWAILM